MRKREASTNKIQKIAKIAILMPKTIKAAVLAQPAICLSMQERKKGESLNNFADKIFERDLEGWSLAFFYYYQTCIFKSLLKDNILKETPNREHWDSLVVRQSHSHPGMSHKEVLTNSP